jgi:hypothetical protein
VAAKNHRPRGQENPGIKDYAMEIGLTGYPAKKKSELISALRNS